MRVVVVEPAEPIVSFEEAARHLRLDGDDERAYVELLIAAAQGHIDGPGGWLGRAIGLQTLELRADCWPSSLPYRPVGEIVSVTVDDVAFEGVGVEMDGLLRVPPRSPRPSKEMAIRYSAGYEVAPAPIKAAIMLMVGDLYANRETTAEGGRPVVQMATTVERLLAPFRVWVL